jgi:hypothetical protein
MARKELTRKTQLKQKIEESKNQEGNEEEQN